MLDNTSDFKSLICYIILVIILYFLQKKNFLVLTFSWSFTSYSLGGGEVFGLPFARFYILLLYIVTLYFLIIPNRPQTEKKKFGFYNMLLVFILIKILLDSLIYGFDEFRSEGLIIAFHVIFLSFYIFHKSFEFNGYRKTLYDFIVSGLTVHGIISVVLFFPILQDQFFSALGFGHRITIFNQDTINSGKPFFLYIIFLLAALRLKLIKSKYLIYLAIIASVFCFLIVFLNGTRQYFIALLLIFIFPLIKFKLKNILITSLLVVIIPLFTDFFLENYSDLGVIARFSTDEIRNEKDEGRSKIWADGIGRMISENPILGLGFRNYGEIIDVSAPNSPIIVLRKDNAHGFFQEVFIEHGVIIGILLLSSFFFTLFKFRSYSENNLAYFNAIYTIMLSFFVTSLFSGSFLNGIGYFYLGIFAYHIPKLKSTK